MFKYSVEYLNESNIWVELDYWTRPIIDKSTLDETHDMTQLFLSDTPIDKPFKPFTRFIINLTEYNDNDEIINVRTFYRTVVSDEMVQVMFNDTELYNHDIMLAEASKEMERYTVDNNSSTNEWAKAFQSGSASGRVSQVIIHDEWYNDYSIYAEKAVGGTVYRNYYYFFYQLYNGYNTHNSVYSYYGNSPPLIIQPPKKTEEQKEADKKETYIYKTLNSLSELSNYKFKDKLPQNIVLGDKVKIPSVYPRYVSPYHILYETYMWVGFEYTRKTDAWINIDLPTITVEHINPSGQKTQVYQNNEITLNQTGLHKIRYTFDRKVWSYEEKRVRLTEALVGQSQSKKYDGSTVSIDFDIFVYPTLTFKSDKLSVYDILNKLINITPTRFNDDYSSLYTLYEDGTEKSIFNRYANIEAPEMIFTNKNLWEALQEVGGVINAIPYLHITDKNNWNVIDFFPLSSEEPISKYVEEDYSNSFSYYDSENYTGCYDMTLENMISPVSSDDGSVLEAGYKISKTLRSEEVEISETSMSIETVYPIYKVNKITYVNYNLPQKEYDLTNYLYESALYETLVSNNVNTGKARALFYKQGQKNISGLSYKVSRTDYADAKNVVSIKEILSHITGTSISGFTLLESKIVVDYIPFLNARVKIYKPNAPFIGIDTSMFQNQTANVVDARATGMKMVANISRVGNLGYTDSVRVYSLKNIPKKGQRTDDGYFVSNVTVEFDTHDLLVSVDYTKDYQKISNWINIHNLQRYYEVSEKQSIHRYVNTNMFYIYGDQLVEKFKENGLNQKNDYTNKNYIADLLVDYGANRKINASLLTAYSTTYFKASGNYLADTDYYVMTTFGNYELFTDYVVGDLITGEKYTLKDDIVSRVYLNSNAMAIGNNISVITDYMDNYGAGYQAVAYQDGNTQAMMNRSIPYSDNFGKIEHLLVENITDSNIVYPTNSTLESNINKLARSLPAVSDIDPETLNPVGEDYITIADGYQNNNKPTFSKIGCSQDIRLLKDSREVVHINQQHHFLVNDPNVVIGRIFTENCRYIQTINESYKLVFLRDTIDMYEYDIDNKDIIDIEIPQDTEGAVLANKIKDLCTEITDDNILDIISTKNNNELLYILPNIAYNGYIIGLTENAVAWAIVTKNDNKLLIGKNEKIDIDGVATKISQSITNKY